MDTIIQILARELGRSEAHVENVVRLIDEGNTIPFIARYRKELHGAMDDTALRTLADRLQYLRNLDKRREEVKSAMEGQGKLTEELSAAIDAAATLAEVEDLYRPYKQKRRTRATVAREKGLAPLAELLLAQRRDCPDPMQAAQGFIDPEKGVETAADALQGANDIVAELLSDDAASRKTLRELLRRQGRLRSLATGEEDSVYRLYYDFEQPLPKLAGHQILAINRGEKEGFLSAVPTGSNQFGAQYERVLPASSVANLYPFNFSGKTDPQGIYIGRDKYGSNVLVDFDKRTEDKTNSNILILGNSGQGKSYLMKLLLCNQREAGKSVLVLDPEHEYEDLCSNLGGTYIDMMLGEYMINPLEPKAWGDGDRLESDSPEAFRKVTRLSQHISYLKDFFRAYKDFSDAEVDTIEIMLMKLYARFGIDDLTDFDTLIDEDYPMMSDLYDLVEKEFYAFDKSKKQLYTEEMLQNICLGLHSMCKGAESKYFNGHTNIKDAEFICFGVKGLMDTNKRLKDTLLFNILSYMSDQLLGRGNTAAAIDELYLFLTNMTAIEYIRNGMKRVRKKESSFILASQNIEDFLLPEIKEFTKPLFSIPSHHFLFNPGNISPTAFIDTLQLEGSEYSLIKYPERGTCLYRCGNERYLLQVIAPAYKAALFGSAGGR